VRLARGDDRPRGYLRIYFHGYHVADVRTVEEVATVLAASASPWRTSSSATGRVCGSP
jgi:hypothetical protein